MTRARQSMIPAVPEPTSLSAQLEAAALRELRAAYEEYNSTFFRGTLRAPVIATADVAGFLGRWARSTRTLELSRELLVGQPWGVVLEVLKHEMAHQYVDEVLGQYTESAHGPVFQKVCLERGIDARAAGLPAGPAADAPESRVLERVRRLLALAESQNQHEAEAAMGAAQRLLLRHNLEVAGATARASYVFRQIGEPSGRQPESRRVLASILSEHFFVQVIWVPAWRVREGKRGSVLEICGTRDNVDLAEYVHAFMEQTAARLWREYKRDRGVRGDADRRTFESGLMTGFKHKLDAQRKHAREAGLVWAGDHELQGYFRQRHPRVRWAAYGGRPRSEAYRDGKRAGASVVLHRGVRQGAGGAVRLLRGK